MPARLLVRLRSLVRRRRADVESGDELQFHIEQETAANVARGMSRADARRAALRALGGVTQARESVRAVRATWADTIWRDVKYGVRSLRRTPAFTLSALATLALVIGANSAVFSLVDTLLWTPLPYPQPEQLARVSRVARTGDRVELGGTNIDGRTWETIHADMAAIVDIAALSGSDQRVNFNAGDRAASVLQARVGAGYFRVLGTTPMLGREFTAEEDRPGGPAVAVLSYALWRSAFAGDAAAIGAPMMLRGETYQIVGVLPERFVNPGAPADVFTPLRPSRSGEGAGSNYSAIVRVRDARRWADADNLLRNISTPLFPPPATAPSLVRHLTLRPFQDAYVEGTKQPLDLLAGAGAIVLLIACVNLPALALARGAGREKEMATRLALGSGRWTIVRQLVIESLLLGAVAGVLGLLVGTACLAALQVLGGDIFMLWRRADVAIGARTVVATGIAAAFASLAIGVVPALQSSRLDMNLALAARGSRSIAGRAGHWGRRVLIGAEVALSVVLLVAAGLFVRTLVNLRALDPGFDPRGVATASVSLQDARYGSAEAVVRLFDDSVAALERTPGVEAAAVSVGLPYDRLLNAPFDFADRPVTDRVPITNSVYVTPRFFETLRIPVRAGRVITADDRAGRPPVAVVNEAFVRLWAENRNPIGRRFSVRGRTGDPFEIVGIVGDVQVRNSGFSVPGMADGPLVTSPIIFIAAAQVDAAFFRLVHTWFSPSWIVRTTDGANGEALLRRAIANADPRLAVAPATSLADVQAASMASQRLMLMLVGACAVVAVLLAAIGIHGLLAQTVVERRRELGIRLALGATAGRLVRGVIGAGLAVAIAGAVVGGVLAWVSARLVSAFVWGVEVHDVSTFVAVIAALLVTAVASSALPALRILRIDPARTLRD